MRLLALGTSVLLACATTPTVEPATPLEEVRCHPLTAPEGWLAEGPMLVGELHGTEETPQAVLALACNAAKAGESVQLGLEIPRKDQTAIEQFLADGDAARLLTTEHWTRPYQDGRSSQAMLKLFEDVRRYRQAGLKIEPFAFDVNEKVEDRDLAMAEAIAERWKARGGPMIVLIGNLHARLALTLPRPSGWRLQQQGLTPHSVYVEGAEGEAWFCDTFSPDSCRPRAGGRVTRDDVTDVGRIVIGPNSMRGYEARLVLPKFTASPPARASSSPSASEASSPPPQSAGSTP